MPDTPAESEEEAISPDQGLFLVGLLLSVAFIGLSYDVISWESHPGEILIMTGIASAPFLGIIYRRLG